MKLTRLEIAWDDDSNEDTITRASLEWARLIHDVGKRLGVLNVSVEAVEVDTE